VSDLLTNSAVAGLADPDRRAAALAEAAEAGWPSAETEEWRYSPVNDLGLEGLAPAPAPASSGAGAVAAVPAVPLADRAATVTVIDGAVVAIDVGPGWVDKGLIVEALGDPGSLTDLDVGSEEVTAYDLLHRAWSPGALVIRTPTGLTVREPVVVRTHHLTPGAVSFPHLVIEAGEESDLTVVEHQTSAPGAGASVPRAELRVGDAARLRYQLLQDLGRDHVQLARQRSSVGAHATLVSGVAAFGGRYARFRSDSALVGRGGTANLVAAYYGDGSQIHDFRTFQHHHARHTRSDLLFKGAQDGSSGSIYTGMIHIHPDGAGSNAFQTNRNIKLSPDAWAWSVPNLEIENNDVRCSHASTVSPVDADQQFYLQARGVPPVAADRLIVAGFFDDVIERLPAAELRAEVRRLIAAKLDGRGAAGAVDAGEVRP